MHMWGLPGTPDAEKNQTDGWHTQMEHELHTATGSIQAWLQISKCAIVEL